MRSVILDGHRLESFLLTRGGVWTSSYERTRSSFLPFCSPGGCLGGGRLRQAHCCPALSSLSQNRTRRPYFSSPICLRYKQLHRDVVRVMSLFSNRGRNLLRDSERKQPDRPIFQPYQR